MSSIDFYFDFVSPYAYLAWTQIHALAARHGRDVRPIPVLFAALLGNSGTLGPAEIPLKRAYLYKDTKRIAATFNVPFAPPPTHPFNPLLALRVAGLDARTIDALFDAAWAGGSGIDSAERVAAIVGDDSLIARANEPAAKARLREATDAAIAAGVFGVPTMIADGELFWGCDSLPHLERFLDGNDPITPRDKEIYRALVPSASRNA
ncbi:MAG TPA: 2-hydroxychromene-2-carboxylate isomerase [Kofleriaceae bacterium]